MARAGAKDNPGSPAVSVVVVTYGSGATLARCLGALKTQSFTDFETILVDNAAGDDAAVVAVKADPGLRLIANDANLGFAAAVNQAARAATGRWLALLNPDAYADPAWLAELLAAADAWPQVRAFGSRQLLAEDPGRLDGLGDAMSVSGFPFRGGYRQTDPHRQEVGEVFSACGGAMLVDRELFLALGGFDERLFCYCEDVDFGYRMRLAGEPTVIVPSAVVLHEGGTASGGPRSDFAVFHGTRNRLWVYVKNTPPILFWISLPMHILATVTLFARHATRRELGAPMRGLMAGLRHIGVALEARREAQASRKVGSAEIARAMTWNPLDVLLRRVFIQPWPPIRPDDA